MMHKAWSNIEEVPYCFSRSSCKFEGHTRKKKDFEPNWAFSDCKSSLNSPMAMKGYKKLKVARERCPNFFSGSSIKFQGHTGWKIDDLNLIWVRLLGRSQLSNPSDLPCLKSKQYIQSTLSVFTSTIDNSYSVFHHHNCCWWIVMILWINI